MNFGEEKTFWKLFEIIAIFIAMGCFALHDYERADFLMLFLIHHRLLKEK